jgi:very-short-patch-repair endonuclease
VRRPLLPRPPARSALPISDPRSALGPRLSHDGRMLKTSHLFGDVPATFLSARALTAAGMTRRQIARCILDGSLLRVRRGRYVPANAPREVIRAAGLGGRLDCVSLLSLLGVFVLDARDLHIQVTVGASRLPSRPPRVKCHWRETAAGREDLHADLIEALAQSCRCQDPRAAVATLDSAWHLGLIGEADIAEIFARLPARFRSLRQLLDPRSESGPESIMRLMLRMLGCDIEVQPRIPGVGRVDFIVDGWLIVECDSRAFHEGWEAQKRDRARDMAAAALGYTTVRPIAEDILYRLPEVLAAMKAIVAHPPRRVGLQNSTDRTSKSPERRQIA